MAVVEVSVIVALRSLAAEFTRGQRAKGAATLALDLQVARLLDELEHLELADMVECMDELDKVLLEYERTFGDSFGQDLLRGIVGYLARSGHSDLGVKGFAAARAAQDGIDDIYPEELVEAWRTAASNMRVAIRAAFAK